MAHGMWFVDSKVRGPSKPKGVIVTEPLHSALGPVCTPNVLVLNPMLWENLNYLLVPTFFYSTRQDFRSRRQLSTLTLSTCSIPLGF